MLVVGFWEDVWMWGFDVVLMFLDFWKGLKDHERDSMMMFP